MNRKFDDDFEAIAFLRSRGYRLTHKWNWYHEPTDGAKVPDIDEHNAALYLFEEWDWGWFTLENEA